MAGFANLSCYCCLLNALFGLGVFDVPARFRDIGKPYAAVVLSIVAIVSYFAAKQIIELAGVSEKQRPNSSEFREKLLGDDANFTRFQVPELPNLVQNVMGQTQSAKVMSFACLLLCVVYLVEIVVALAYNFTQYLSNDSQNDWKVTVIFTVISVGFNLVSIEKMQIVHILGAVSRVILVVLVLLIPVPPHHQLDSLSTVLNPYLILPLLLITFQYHVVIPQILTTFSPQSPVCHQSAVITSAWVFSLLLGWFIPLGLSHDLLGAYCDGNSWRNAHPWVPIMAKGLIGGLVLTCVHVHLRVLGGIIIAKVYDPNLGYARDTHPYGVPLIYIILPVLLCLFPWVDAHFQLNLLQSASGGDSAAVVALVITLLLIPYSYLKDKRGNASWVDTVIVYFEYLLLIVSVGLSLLVHPGHFAIIFLVVTSGVVLLLLLFEFLTR